MVRRIHIAAALFLGILSVLMLHGATPHVHGLDSHVHYHGDLPTEHDHPTEEGPLKPEETGLLALMLTDYVEAFHLPELLITEPGIVRPIMVACFTITRPEVLANRHIQSTYWPPPLPGRATCMLPVQAQRGPPLG